MPVAEFPERRFPPPWTVEELDACFVVRDCACSLPCLRKLAAVRYVHAQ